FDRYFATHRARLIGRSVRLPAQRRDGFEVEIELTLSVLSGDGRDLVVGVLRDLTGRIEEAEQRYRSLIQSVDAVVWEADAGTGAFSFVSRRAEDLLGYPVEQWL